MSNETVDVVRRLFDAAARGDTASVMALYDSTVEWDASRTQRGAMAGRVVRGRKALLEWLREWYAAWQEIEDRIEELIDVGDGRAVSIMVQRGRGRTSGVEVEDRLGAVWTVREGTVVRVAWFPSPEDALEATGLRK